MTSNLFLRNIDSFDFEWLVLSQLSMRKVKHLRFTLIYIIVVIYEFLRYTDLEDITTVDMFAICDNIRDALLIIVDQKKVHWVNHTFENNFDYSKEEIVGKLINENFLGKNFLTKLDFFIKNCDSVPKTYLNDIVLTAKTTGKPAYTAHYQIELKTFLFKGKRSIMASFRRTIPRKQQLIDIDDLLSFNLLGIAIVRDGKSLYVNQRYAEMYGYTREEMIKWEPYEFVKVIHPDDQEFVKTQSMLKERGEQGLCEGRQPGA